MIIKCYWLLHNTESCFFFRTAHLSLFSRLIVQDTYFENLVFKCTSRNQLFIFNHTHDWSIFVYSCKWQKNKLYMETKNETLYLKIILVARYYICQIKPNTQLKDCSIVNIIDLIFIKITQQVFSPLLNVLRCSVWFRAADTKDFPCTRKRKDNNIL